MKSINACRRRCGCLGALVLAYSLTLFAATTDEVIGVGEKRVAEGAAAQKQVDELSDQTEDLASEYKQVTKVVDGLNVYNDLLHKQVDNQLAEIAALTDSIGKVALIERQIMPLMVRMIDSFEEFVRLDVPFLAEERGERLQRLRTMMERSDVTAAEKFRLVLEAYQIEGEYGRTIEAYRGSLWTSVAAHARSTFCASGASPCCSRLMVVISPARGMSRLAPGSPSHPSSTSRTLRAVCAWPGNKWRRTSWCCQ